MINLLSNDLKRSLNLKRMLIAALAAWTALFFLMQFFSEDMTEDRLLEKLHLGIVDEESSELSRMLVQSFEGNDRFSSMIDIRKGSRLELNAAYETGDLTALVIIPDGFTKSLLQYENMPLTVILNPNRPMQTAVLSEMLASYSDYIRAVDASTYGLYTTLKASGFPDENLARANDLYSFEMISTALGRNRLFQYVPIDTFPATTSGTYFSAAMLVMVAAFSSAGVLPLVFEDLRQNCLQRYLMIRGGLVQWVVSKLLALSLGMTLMSFLIALPVMFYLDMKPAQILILIGQIFVLGLFFSALALFIGVAAKNESAATVATNLMVFALGLSGGNLIPLPLMPKSIQNISALTPNYWAIRSLLVTLAGVEGRTWIIPAILTSASAALALTCARRLEKTLHHGGVRYE